MSTESELPEASDTATRILSWSRPVNLDELTLEISKACVAYAERQCKELTVSHNEKLRRLMAKTTAIKSFNPHSNPILMIEHALETAVILQNQFEELKSRAEKAEAELMECKKWKEEDPRMLREQIRVADAAFQGLHERHVALETELASVWEELGKVKSEFIVAAKASNQYRDELDKLREDVKPLLAVLDSCNTVCDENPLRDFLEKHPELKEKP